MIKLKNHPIESKLRSLAFLVLMLLMICAPLTGALGVSPGRKTVDFIPNGSLELELDVINPEPDEAWVTLSAAGDIKEMIFLEETDLYLRPGDFRTPFKILFKFPSEMTPGLHSGSIIITPRTAPNPEGMLSAFVTPVILLYVKVPYPSKYADVSIYVVSVDEGTPVPIYLQLDNIGSEDIMSAGANIEIFGPKGDPLASLVAGPASIEKGAFLKIMASPSPILRRGDYIAKISAYYDDYNESFISNFSIGEPLIRIRELKTRKLAYGQINKVLFSVRNEWNKELAAKGFIDINGIQSEMPSFSLKADEEKELTGFLDTTGLPKGEYNLTITLAYASQIKSEKFPVVIVDKAQALPSAPLSAPLLFIGAILLLIAVIIVIVLFVKKKSKELE
jgi:hypothetical protein